MLTEKLLVDLWQAIEKMEKRLYVKAKPWQEWLAEWPERKLSLQWITKQLASVQQLAIWLLVQTKLRELL